MEEKELQDLVNEALIVKGKIKRIEKEVLSDLAELLKKLSAKILKEMKAKKLDGLNGVGGNLVLVSRSGQVKFDTAKLMADLGVMDLKKYENQGKGSEFLKYNLN